MNANLFRPLGLVPVFDRECIQKFVRNDSPIRKLPGTNMDLQSKRIVKPRWPDYHFKAV
jgi:hypothetical protein